MCLSFQLFIRAWHSQCRELSNRFTELFLYLFTSVFVLLPGSGLASHYSTLDIAIHHIYLRVFYSCHPHEAGMTSETLDIFPKDNIFVWGHSLYFLWIQSCTTLNSARWENVFTLLLLISRLKMASQRFHPKPVFSNHFPKRKSIRKYNTIINGNTAIRHSWLSASLLS